MPQKNTKNPFLKPFLKWAGGKRQLLPELRKHIPSTKQIETYYEPFLGAGAVLFDIQPEKAIVNDTNQELINCYETIRDSLEDLITVLENHTENMKGREQDYYYEVRDWDRHKNSYSSRSNVERAARIIFLNKTCYNGLFRVNSKGLFNVPFGRYKNPNILDKPVLIAVHKFLKEKDIFFQNGDFEKCVEASSKKDFVYFDPPYDPISSSSSFTGYDVNGFDQSEQERLKKIFDNLTQKKCKALLSNSFTPFIKELYSEYNCIPIAASRSLNSNPSKRGKINEILVKNF